MKGNKDDTKDSKWIGDLFRLGLVKGNYITCKKVRILREYTRYRYKLVSCRSSEKNRYQNALTVCNVALDSVVSDIFGKSSTSIIDYLLEQSGTSINHEEIASKLLRSSNPKKMLSSFSVPFRVSNVIVQSLSSPKSVLTCLSSQVLNVCVAGLV